MYVCSIDYSQCLIERILSARDLIDKRSTTQLRSNYCNKNKMLLNKEYIVYLSNGLYLTNKRYIEVYAIVIFELQTNKNKKASL